MRSSGDTGQDSTAASSELRAVSEDSGRRVAVLGDAVARRERRVAHASVHRDIVHAAVLPPAGRRHRRLMA